MASRGKDCDIRNRLVDFAIMILDNLVGGFKRF
jgi:hypothetical protein